MLEKCQVVYSSLAQYLSFPINGEIHFFFFKKQTRPQIVIQVIYLLNSHSCLGLLGAHIVPLDKGHEVEVSKEEVAGDETLGKNNIIRHMQKSNCIENCEYVRSHL